MADYLIYYRALFQYALMLGLAIFAFYRGDGPEKIATMVLPCMVIMVYLYQFAFPQGGQYEKVDIGLFLIDLFGLVVFGWLAIKANRMYPLWLLGAQLICVMMHFARDISAGMEGVVYFILTRAPSYIQILALAIGLYCHRRRIARYGSYRSWRVS